MNGVDIFRLPDSNVLPDQLKDSKVVLAKEFARVTGEMIRRHNRLVDDNVKLERRCNEYRRCNDLRKEEKRLVEAFTQMLLREKRTTKAELSKYFKKVK